MRKLALVSGFPCLVDAVDYFNSQGYDAIIGLGDVECPQYLENFYGILGEMESVFVMKYLKSTSRLIDSDAFERSFNLGLKVFMTHFPPKGYGTGTIGGFTVGKDVPIPRGGKVLVLHGHSDYPSVVKKDETTVVSVGSVLKGFYVELSPDTLELSFKRLAMR
ncbi:MAG: hypothetical protein MPF33_05270 [Candidatus Aramenus sp.]|jgi:predicted phosphodiesterase|nr:hypothetical protein [Candidatus Aramenus sp.]